MAAKILHWPGKSQYQGVKTEAYWTFCQFSHPLPVRCATTIDAVTCKRCVEAIKRKGIR